MNFKLLLLIISTTGYWFYFVDFVKVRILIAPFLWACLIVMILYVFGLANALSIGANFSLLLGIFLGGFTLWKNRRKLTKSLQSENLIYPLFAVPFIIFYFSIPDNFLFLGWDELSYWAKGQRLIYNSNALLGSDSPISFKNYPPAQQLFQYYWTISTYWSEKNVLLAQNSFIFFAILAVIGALITKPIWALFTYWIACTLIYFYHSDYVTIYSDSLLSVCFAACIALVIKNQRRFQDEWSLVICLCAFVLIKEVALIFTCIVLLIYMINLFWNSDSENDNRNNNRFILVSKYLLLCTIPVVLTVLSWKWHVSKILASKTGLMIPALETLSQDPFRQRFGATVTGFFFNLIKPAYFETASVRFGFSLSLIEVIFGLLIISFLIIAISLRQQTLKIFLTLLVMFAGMFSYLAFLLWSYLFYFTEYEGIRLASFDRYVMTYVLGWTILILVLLMQALSQKKSKLWLIVPILLLTYILYAEPQKMRSDMKLIQVDRVILEKREKALELANKTKQFIKAGEKVYFIAQNSNGFEKHMFDYSMIPYPASECWSVGEKYGEGDVWTCQQNLKELIKDYAYLAIYNADEQFWNDNENLFEEDVKREISGVFKIIKKDNEMKIIKMP